MANYISIKKIIDVSTTLPISSQARRNFANACFMMIGNGYTTGTVINYTNSADIANDLGSNSEAYKASLIYFQGGFRGIKPSNFSIGFINTADAIASTQGYFKTGDVGINLPYFQTVTNGQFQITVDGGAPVAISNINFTGITNISQMVPILQNSLNLAQASNVVVSYDEINQNFIFTSQTYGNTSKVLINSVSGGTGTNLIGKNYFNIYGSFTSGNVSSNLTNFEGCDDGEFQITINGGTPISITGLNFTSATTFDNIKTILQTGLTTAGITNVLITYSSTDTNFIFTNTDYTTTSSIIIASISGGTGTDLTGVNYFNDGTEIIGGGTTVGVSGTEALTISAFLKNSSYYHIILSNQFTTSQILEWSNAVEASTDIAYGLWLQSNDINIPNTSLSLDTGTIALQFFNKKLSKSWLTYTDILSNYTNVSFASYFGVVGFSEARPLGSLAFKQFSGQLPNTNLTNNNFDNLTAKNTNFYAVYGEAGRNIGYEGVAPNGNFINDIIFADWLNYNITYNVFDWLITKNKVRFTTSDFSELYQVIEQTFIQALGFGAIAGGTDPDTGENLMNGYKITIPSPSSIPSNQKSQGLLEGIECVALLSGNVTKIVITNTLKI